MNNTVATSKIVRSLVDRSMSQKSFVWHGITIVVHPFVPLEQVMDIVNRIMVGCYNESGDIFLPEMIDFSFKVNIVYAYTDVELPNDVDEQYEIMYNTDLFDSISSMLNQSQLDSIKKAIQICLQR